MILINNYKIQIRIIIWVVDKKKIVKSLILIRNRYLHWKIIICQIWRWLKKIWEAIMSKVKMEVLEIKVKLIMIILIKN